MVTIAQLCRFGDEWLAAAVSCGAFDEAVGVVQRFAGRGSDVENLADTNVQFLYFSLNLIKFVRAQPGCEAKIRGAASALGFIAFGNMGENLVYYWDVGQLREAGDKAIGSTIRLGGVVKEGTVDWRPDESHLEFIITDGSQDVPVECSGAPPQMFRE